MMTDTPHPPAGEPASTLTLLRHGQSEWNRLGRFTGWTDIDLSPAGAEEARRAARLLGEHNVRFDVVMTSVLKRAIRTAWIVEDTIDTMWTPVVRDWRLNERHYGALQGMNKKETAERVGSEQVQTWRRDFRAHPPPLEMTDQRHPRFDRRYADLAPSELPCTESLEDTMRRVMRCWRDSVTPRLSSGQHVLIVAHGNSLRALVKHLLEISDSGISTLEIPTGEPWIFELDAQLRVASHRVLTVAEEQPRTEQ